MVRFRLPCLALVLLAAGSNAQAGAIMFPSTQMYSAGFEGTNNSDAGMQTIFNDTSLTGYNVPAISSSLAYSYTSPSGDISMSGASSGSSLVTPGPNNFTTFHFDSQTSTLNSNTGSTSTSSQVDFRTVFSGGFSITTPYNYTLSINGQSNSTSVVSKNGGDTGDGSIAYAYLQGFSVIFGKSFFSGSSNGNNIIQDPPLTVSGTLAPGEYSIFAETEGNSFLNGNYPGGGGGTGTAQDSASLTFDLQLTPAAAPEPTSLTLASLGMVSMLGYGWRRRRQVAHAAIP